MVSPVLRAVACASALGTSAVALSIQPEGLRQAVRGGVPPGELGPLGKASEPLAADLERWAHLDLLSENSSFHRATVGSRRGVYNLTIATFGRGVDQEGVSSELVAGTGWQNDLITELCRRFRDTAGKVGNFLDVGASIGTFTIPMADCLRFRGGRVIAVEGMPPIADHLAVGLLANNLQNVDMYTYAMSASDDPKEVTMSLNPVNKELYEVPLTTGDRMLASNPALKAIMVAKVGIEGREGHFLKGSQRLFSQYPPCILTIELNPEWLERAGTPVEEILVRLAGWGYTGVPTAALLRASSTHQGNTRLITQRNLTACLERVGTYAAESNVRPETNLSDPNVVSALLAREARAKELDDMLVREEPRKPADALQSASEPPAGPLLEASWPPLEGEQSIQQAGRPLAADLERWAHGPLFSENSSFHHALYGSRIGPYNLDLATFGRGADHGVSSELLDFKGWENDYTYELCWWFRQTAGDVGNFLDVGANVGTFTMPLADCLKSSGGRVIAVEGMPPIADHLAVGILANNLQNVDMYMYAVGAPDDPNTVTMSLNPVNKGGSAVKGNKAFTEKRDIEDWQVPLTTGDRMLASNPALKAIMIAKVDIEGHEGHFLKGSQRLFSRYPPCAMTIELNPEWLERAGTPVEEILVRLAGWGYTGVPTAAHLRASNTQGKTRLIMQRNLTACLERVKTYAAESNMRPEINYSDPNALSAVLAREARAKELEAMLVHDPRPKNWWKNARIR